MLKVGKKILKEDQGQRDIFKPVNSGVYKDMK